MPHSLRVRLSGLRYKKIISDKDYDRLCKALDNEIKWIPVSERLPQELVHVLCCDKDGYITIGFVSEKAKDWCFVDDEIDIDVVAWMPLPQPYEPKGVIE